MSNDEPKDNPAQKPSGETVRLLEGRWNCTSCGTKEILGRFKECPSCSSPREEGRETDFTFGQSSGDGSVQAETVTDGRAIQEAGRGEDWFCRFCNSASPGDLALCGKCGAEKSKAALTPDQVRVRGLAVQIPTTSAPVSSKNALGKTVLKLFVAGSLLFGALMLWDTFQAREVEAEVEWATWKHQIVRETFRPQTRQAWQDELRPRLPKLPVQGSGEEPGVFNIRNCQRKLRRTERVVCGQERVCRPVQETYVCGSERKCRVKDLKNGFAQEICQDVPKQCQRTAERCAMEDRYCPREIFGFWCDYDQYAWESSGSSEASGQGGDLRWPTLELGAMDRLRKSGFYEVRLRERGTKKSARSWTLKPETENEFLALARARAVQVNLGGLGSLKGAQPKD